MKTLTRNSGYHDKTSVQKSFSEEYKRAEVLLS